jgi:cyclopropane-fatty-acyl-phospholipid synthase
MEDHLQDRLLERGLIPDLVLRRIVRARVKGLVEDFERIGPDARAARERAVLDRLDSGPIAVETDEANRQHYDVPPEFFRLVLGPRMKYSCCLWPPSVHGLGEAEETMFSLTAERADLGDGQSILDLGCGWGSLALWAGERYPHSRVVALSNSLEQGSFIERRCQARGIRNVEVVTAEVGQFAPGRRFDRIVSVEMFEHLRNHGELMRRIAGWLQPDGRLFVHVFCHRRQVYEFDAGGTGSWMARHFFCGGMMPSWDYLTFYQEHLGLADRWQVGGEHYALTLRAWLANLDRRRDRVLPVLERTYGADLAGLRLAHWRLFFIACEETFALASGTEYCVGHYLFAPR